MPLRDAGWHRWRRECPLSFVSEWSTWPVVPVGRTCHSSHCTAPQHLSLRSTGTTRTLQRCAQYRPRLEYKLIPCGFLHWGGLQAPGGTIAAIYITQRRYLLIQIQPRLTELAAAGMACALGDRTVAPPRLKLSCRGRFAPWWRWRTMLVLWCMSRVNSGAMHPACSAAGSNLPRELCDNGQGL